MTTTPTNNTLAAALEAHRKSVTSRMASNKPSPHLFIVGPSGTGKSRSIKNLPPEKTVVINVESKILPFDNAKVFDENSAFGFSDSNQVDNVIKAIANVPEIKYIVVDSFTKYQELAMSESRKIGGGWEIMNRYYAQIFNLFEFIKKVPDKIFIFISNDEIVKVETPNGATVGRRHITCDGKWLTKIEKEFAIVLFTELKVTMEGGKRKSEYKFITNSDGVTSAKSPEGLFAYEIDNDLLQVVKQVEKYFGLPTTA
jgi:hypothetical protein